MSAHRPQESPGFSRGEEVNADPPPTVYRVVDTLPPDATIIATTNSKEWIRRDFTAQEAADLLGVKVNVIRMRFRAGKFPMARQIGHRGVIVIPGSDIAALLDSERAYNPGFKGRRKP